MALPSPSSHWRATNCPSSEVLPHTFEPSSNASKRGTTVHTFVPRAAEIGRDAALAEVPLDDPGRSLCEVVQLDDIPTDYLAAEVETAVAYDVEFDRARRIDMKGRAARDYGPVGESEFAGTPDAFEIVGFRPGSRRLLVDDLKTGRPSPAYRVQVDRYALALARLHDFVPGDTATTRLIYIDEHGEVRVAERTLTAAMLDQVKGEVVDMLAAIRKVADPAVEASPREWCRYCPAKRACPKYCEAVTELATLTPPDWTKRLAEMVATDEGAATWWTRLPLLEAVVAEARRVLDGRAIEKPFRLPSGQTVGPVTEVRRSITDDTVVIDTLRELHGDAVATAAAVTTTKRVVNLTTMKDAIAIVAPKGQKTKLFDKAIEVLLERKGVTAYRTTSAGVMPEKGGA